MKSHHETTPRSSPNSAPKSCPPAPALSLLTPAKQLNADSNSPAPIRPLRRDRNRNGTDTRRRLSAARRPQVMSDARAPASLQYRCATIRPPKPATPQFILSRLERYLLHGHASRQKPKRPATVPRPRSPKDRATYSERQSADPPASPPQKYDFSPLSEAVDMSAFPCPPPWAIAPHLKQNNRSRPAPVLQAFLSRPTTPSRTTRSRATTACRCPAARRRPRR